MIVTEVIEYSKSRYKIMIDYEFAFVLYKGELHLYQIKAGEELPENIYLKICGEVLPKRAKLRCMNLLKSRRYTEKQLLDKLLQGDYTPEIAAEAIDYVKSYGYIDDEQYVRDYISTWMNSRSKSRISNDLRKKGIAAEIAEEIWAAEAGGHTAELEEEQILYWLEKKGYHKESASIQEIRRISAFLYRRGFQPDIIRRLMAL